MRGVAGNTAWLITSVDIQRSAHGVGLVLRHAAHEPVRLDLTTQSLSQWLGIVHDACRKAQWPLDVWPEWMTESTAPKWQAGILH